MVRHNAAMLKATVSVESHTTNFRTVRLIVGLICSCTETSKRFAVPDIENRDLYRAKVLNIGNGPLCLS